MFTGSHRAHRSRPASPSSPALSRWISTLLAAVVLATVVSCAEPSPESAQGDSKEPATDAPVPEGAPKLVLMLIVDQMRGDYLDRFAPLFEGGFRRLREEGQVFTDAQQDHASTSTSPGHATIATGTYPERHGIIGNGWFDRELGDEVYSVEDPEHGRSPSSLLVPTLADQLKEHWPSSKVYSVGGKDRSTILMAGSNPDGAFWYHRQDGSFTTSSFYIEDLGDDGELPRWLEEFHGRDWTHQWFGTTWTPIHPTEELQPFGIAALDRGDFSRSFPYAFGGPSLYPGSGFYSAIYASPWMDAYVTELAEAVIDAAELGQDAVPDFLAVNLSSTDAVGHTFGPDSPELVDNLVRLDRDLGELLDHVDQAVGLENVAVVLSSDHGVGQVPEVAAARGDDAARLASETTVCVQQAGQEIEDRFGLEGADWMPETFYFDRSVLQEGGVDLDDISRALADRIAECPRIDRAMLPADLEHDGDDPLLTLFGRGYHPERSADILVHLTENTLATSTTASHGSAHRYDRWVPMTFLLPGLPAQRIDDPASVTDIVPTIASLVGLPEAETDGVDRLPALRGSTTDPSEPTSEATSSQP